MTTLPWPLCMAADALDADAVERLVKAESRVSSSALWRRGCVETSFEKGGFFSQKGVLKG
jgi:hypothetical protein